MDLKRVKALGAHDGELRLGKLAADDGAVAGDDGGKPPVMLDGLYGTHVSAHLTAHAVSTDAPKPHARRACHRRRGLGLRAGPAAPACYRSAVALVKYRRDLG